jgi:ADP-L-glycero-D-manno-heptose 6-epimerase
MAKSILVTGGTGFIGSNIVNQFKNKNYNIVVIDRTIKDHNKIDNVEYLTFDLKEHRNLNNLLKDYSFDYIFHEAAIVDTTYNSDDIFEINTNSINSLIKLAEKSDGKLIYASSCAVYGNTPIPNKVNFQELPLNKYGESKLYQDQIVRNYLNNQENRVQIVGLRYSNVYGNGEYHKGNMSSMIYKINKEIKTETTVKLFEYGEQKRDFIYIDDIVGYNVSAAYSNKTGIFNAGYGNSFSFNDLMRFFEIYYNKNIEINFIKNPYNFYQNHTLCEIDETLYKPIFDLKNGMNNYLDLMNCHIFN